MLGAPIAHSLSPVLHRAAYQALGLTGWSYQAIECDEAGLAGLIAGCGPDWAGLSLTMPLKRAVLSLLDEAEPLVAEVGAANTVRFDAGLRHGHNTDVPGMITAITEVAGDLPADPGPVLILGGGATACSALAAARGLGAARSRPPSATRSGPVTCWPPPTGSACPSGSPRSTARRSPRPGCSSPPPRPARPTSYAERIRQGTLSPGCVLDVVYHPWPTALATAAQQAGVPTAGGFALLLHQAARQVELMTGKPAPVEAMRAAGLAALAAGQ